MKAFEAKASRSISLIKTSKYGCNDRVKLRAIKKGDIITVSQSGDDYYLWHDGVYSFDPKYIGEKIRDLSLS